MTELLYMRDCYLKEFNATVIAVRDNFVELDKTAFYPLGGGEPNDTGKIISNGNEFIVKNVIKKEGKVLHEIDRKGLNVGEKVHGILDWEKRYKIMRMHTASHLLSAIFNKESGALITGNQLDFEKSRIDFSLENFDREKINEFVEKANQLIKENRDVKIYFLKREEAFKIPGIVKLAGALPPKVEELRIVEIDGIDIQADGGNHVKNLAEIGKIEVVKLENKGKNNRRIYFTLN